MRRSAMALAASLLGACGWGHPVRMLSESRPFSTRESMRVQVDLPAGTIRLERGAPQDLYRLQFSYCTSHTKPGALFSAGVSGDDPETWSRLGISADIAPGIDSDEEPNLVSLLLRTGIPLDLRVAGGGGRVELDLTALSVKSLAVHGASQSTHIAFKAGNPVELERMRVVSGSGEARLEGLGWGSVSSLQFYGGASPSRIDWSGPGPREAAAFVDAGTGDLELAFPKDLGVAISGTEIEAGRDAPEGMHREGRVWVSSDYAKAERHLTVVLERGAARLTVRWVR